MKKFTSVMTAILLMASGVSVLSASSANASSPVSSFQVGCIQGPIAGQSTSSVICSNSIMNAEWQLSNATWSPTVSSTFQANTAYSVTYRATPLQGFFTVPTINANVFTVNTSYSGSPTGTTVTSLAATAGDPYMTFTITFPITSSGGGSGGGSPSGVIASTSTISEGQVNPTLTITSNVNFQLMTSNYIFNAGTTGLTWNSASTVTANTYIVGLRGTARGGTITFQGKTTAFSPPLSAPTNTLTFVVPGGSSSSSSQTAEQIAAAASAAAKAAAEAAAAVRAAEIAAAQSALSTVLKADKPGTLSEYRSANINITTTAALTRLNAEVLKLSVADRTDFAKIKAIADKIEFDESFFNSTARPTLSTYAKYEVVGITERILPTVNAKVLELPAALRVDAKAIQDLVKVESFVDRVANTETRSTVSANVLVEKGLLSSASPYKYSVVQGLAKYPEGSLNTMAKIEAAIKEQIYKAEAPKRRLAEIKAKIAARNK